MARPSNLILYSVALGLNIFSIVYLLIEWPIMTYIVELYFLAMVASTIYFIFLVILEFQGKGKLDSLTEVTSDSNKDFMTTTFSKFLFPIFYAIFFFFICAQLLGTNFKPFTGQYFFSILALLHMNVLLPLFLLFEMMLVQHARDPKYVRDIIILSAVILIRWLGAVIFKWLFLEFYTFGMGVMELGQTLITLLVCINGYFVYDYRVFKAANPDGNYAIHIEQ